MLRDVLKGYGEKTSKSGMKEENSKRRERVVVIDFHMDPKLVSGEKQRREERREENRDGPASPLVTAPLFADLSFSLSLPRFLSSFLSAPLI